MDELALFTTPIFATVLPNAEALNAQLCPRLLDEERTGAGLVRSNVGGWHSTPDLSQRGEDCYRGLMQTVVEQVAQVVSRLAERSGQPALPVYRYGLQGWAMIMRDGDYTVLHDHGEAHWSTVYFADAAESSSDERPLGGVLAFVDSRPAGRPIPGVELFPSTFTIRPRTGLLVIFPGWLQHYVHPYRGQRPRISISCNVVMETMPTQP